MNTLTLISQSGIRYHIVPEGDPVLWPSEIVALAGLSPEQSEIILKIKQVFGNESHYSSEEVSEASRQLAEQLKGDTTLALLNFSKEEMEKESSNFGIIPAGKYTAQIANHEFKATTKGGRILKFTWEVTGPTNVGRKVFDNLNLVCESEKATMIAWGQLHNLCKIADAENYYNALFEQASTADDPDELQPLLDELPLALYSKDITLNVSVKPAQGQYSEGNEVKGYYPAGTPTAASNGNGAAKPALKKPAWR